MGEPEVANIWTRRGESMMTELTHMVRASKVPKIKLVVEVTPSNIISKLEDRNGQRGSAVSGIPGEGERYDTLEGQAMFLLLQEARTALKADDDG